jgi:hypothetical protein
MYLLLIGFCWKETVRVRHSYSSKKQEHINMYLRLCEFYCPVWRLDSCGFILYGISATADKLLKYRRRLNINHQHLIITYVIIKQISLHFVYNIMW